MFLRNKLFYSFVTIWDCRMHDVIGRVDRFRFENFCSPDQDQESGERLQDHWSSGSEIIVVL